LHLRSPTVARGHELKVSSLTAQHPTFRVARVQRFVGQVLLFPQGHEQDAVGAPNLGNIEDEIRLPNPGQVISPWLAPIRTRARCFFASLHPVVLKTRSFPAKFLGTLLSTYKSARDPRVFTSLILSVRSKPKSNLMHELPGINRSINQSYHTVKSDCLLSINAGVLMDHDMPPKGPQTMVETILLWSVRL